jgi:hypothetical protein
MMCFFIEDLAATVDMMSVGGQRGDDTQSLCTPAGEVSIAHRFNRKLMEQRAIS